MSIQAPQQTGPAIDGYPTGSRNEAPGTASRPLGRLDRG